MLRLALAIMIVTGFLGAGAAVAADEIPLPIKKPRDATGRAAVPDRNPVQRSLSSHAKSSTSGTASEKNGGQTSASRSKPSSTKKTSGNDTTGKEAPRTSNEQQAKKTRTKKPKEPTTATSDDGQDKTNGKDAEQKPKVLTEWPEDVIVKAKADCEKRLKGLDAVTLPEAPFRKNECGAAAPVRLVSVGAEPNVVLDPPAIVTCDMVAGMEQWVKNDLQPLAKKHLGTKISKIKVMSDYSCRNAYGRTTTKLSEHGRANALDIRGFVTVDERRAYLLKGWGPANRDIIAAKKAIEEEARKRAAEIMEAAQAAAKEHAAANKAESRTRKGESKNNETKQNVERTVTLTGGASKKQPLSSTTGTQDANEVLTQPRQLGGPGKGPSSKTVSKKGKNTKASNKKETSRRETASVSHEAILNYKPTPVSRFLHGAHAAACKIFGTTLGPEANNAHRNHFHVDMAPRKRRKYCE